MPVLDKTLATRRANIKNSIAALTTKKPRNLTAQDADLIDRYEDELHAIEQQIGTTHDGEHTRAFTQWIRRGEDAVDTHESRNAFADAEWRSARLHYREGQLISTRPEYRFTVGIEGTPTGGAYFGSIAGAFVPLSFIKQIVSAAKYTAPWFDIAELHVTATGAPLVWPADNDIAVSAVAIAEGGTTTAADITLVGKALGTYRYTSLVVKVSNELVQDTGIDIDAYLAGRFAARMMRGLDAKYTSGAGTTEPLGALTGLTPSLTVLGAADTDGTSAANTIGLRDVVALEKALDPAYRPKARWLMHPNTLAALRQVKDSQKRPVFESLNRPEGPSLLGYPVTPAPSMDQLQAAASSPTVTKVPLAFGDVSYFKIRLVQPTLIRLATLYAVNFQTGFLLNWRTDSALVDGASTNRAIVTAQTIY